MTGLRRRCFNSRKRNRADRRCWGPVYLFCHESMFQTVLDSQHLSHDSLMRWSYHVDVLRRASSVKGCPSQRAKPLSELPRIPLCPASNGPYCRTAQIQLSRESTVNLVELDPLYNVIPRASVLGMDTPYTVIIWVEHSPL